MVLYLVYLLNYSNPINIHTETWSGNYRMINLAKKCCFQEVLRKVNYIIVKDIKYDAITFKLNQKRFYNKYKDLHEIFLNKI